VTPTLVSMRPPDAEHERYAQAAGAVMPDEPVIAAYLYGSRARGDARPDSDVDVAVLVSPHVDQADYLAMSLRLARRLESAINQRVDEVSVLNQAPPRLRFRVLRDGILLFTSDDEERVRYETATYPMVMDFEFMAARLDEALLADHAAGRR